jgi:uracil-DNA glycosylase family 4
MGFLFGPSSVAEKKLSRKQAVPAEWLNKMRCSACPRNSDKMLKHPKMKPTGSKHPTIYVLGEAPGKTEDEKGRQFIGDSGQLLRGHLDTVGLNEYPIRWNNTIRCRPPQNRTPEPNEIECCRNFQIEDIEKYKPRVVIVFGNVALHWAITGLTGVGITAWRGRFVPAKIGTHECWVYPMVHPSAVLRSGGGDDNGKEEREKAAAETVFRTDLEALARFLKSDPSGKRRPRIVGEKDYRAGIKIYGDGTRESAAAVVEFLARAEQDDFPGVDLETKNLRPYWPDSRILTCAVSIRNGQETIAFPVDWSGAWQSRKLRDKVWQALVRFCHAKKPRKIAHNHKFDAEWLGYKIARSVVKRKWACTQAQAYILDSRQGMLDLDTQVRLYCGFWLKVISKIDRKKDLEKTYKLEDILMYNGLDAKWVVPVYWHQQSELAKRDKHLELARERIETSSTLVLAQLQGLLVDKEAHAELLEEFTGKREEVTERMRKLKSFKRFYQLAKKWPDVDSKDDMQLLFTRINPCPELLNEKGKVSTSEDLLAELNKKRYPEVAAILDMREVNKVLSTYLETLPSKIAPDGCIHTNFNPFLTDTERLSSEDPNVQNWPKRQNKNVRRVIVAGVAGG